MKSDKQLFQHFLKFLLKQDSPAKLEEWLGILLTPKELEELPKRLQIIEMLQAGIPQREIAEKLNVGIATVTRGSRELQRRK